MKLQASDARLLVYFWQEKEDLERFSKWGALQPLLAAEHPEIIKAWNDYNAIRVTLETVLNRACDLAEQREFEERG